MFGNFTLKKNQFPGDWPNRFSCNNIAPGVLIQYMIFHISHNKKGPKSIYVIFLHLLSRHTVLSFLLEEESNFFHSLSFFLWE